MKEQDQGQMSASDMKGCLLHDTHFVHQDFKHQ